MIKSSGDYVLVNLHLLLDYPVIGKDAVCKGMMMSLGKFPLELFEDTSASFLVEEYGIRPLSCQLNSDAVFIVKCLGSLYSEVFLFQNQHVEERACERVHERSTEFLDEIIYKGFSAV